MNHLIGRWKITWMEMWDQEYVNLIEPGYFLFGGDDMGDFMFGTVRGSLDTRISLSQTKMEFSWQGDDSEGGELCGRGIFEFSGRDHGEGLIYIHNGDESAIKIEGIK